MTKSEFLGTSMNLNIAENSYLKLKAISALNFDHPVSISEVQK